MTKKFYSSEGASGTSLLRDAHERLEAMAAAAALISRSNGSKQSEHLPNFRLPSRS